MTTITRKGGTLLIEIHDDAISNPTWFRDDSVHVIIRSCPDSGRQMLFERITDNPYFLPVHTTPVSYRLVNQWLVSGINYQGDPYSFEMPLGVNLHLFTENERDRYIKRHPGVTM